MGPSGDPSGCMAYCNCENGLSCSYRDSNLWNSGRENRWRVLKTLLQNNEMASLRKMSVNRDTIAMLKLGIQESTYERVRIDDRASQKTYDFRTY